MFNEVYRFKECKYVRPIVNNRYSPTSVNPVLKVLKDWLHFYNQVVSTFYCKSEQVHLAINPWWPCVSISSQSLLLQFAILTKIYMEQYSSRIESLPFRRSDFLCAYKKVKTIGSKTTLNYQKTINSVSFMCNKKYTHHIISSI